MSALKLKQAWLGRGLQAVNSRLAEFMHLCVIYLGIAMIVTLAAGAVVPSMRSQATLIYHVVVEALRPQVNGAQLVVEPDAAALSQSLPSAYTDFAQILQQSAAGLKISGVSAGQLQALRSYISRKYRVAPQITNALIQMAYTNGREKNIDPLLVLAVIAIESTYNPFVESHAGAQGLMQVMTRVHQDKLEMYSEGDLSVFSPEANIRAGTQILADCRKRRGSITGALSCYVGAIGPSDGGYGAKVLAERRRIALASGIAVKD